MHANGATMRKDKVLWTPEEREKLLEQVLTMRQNDPTQSLTGLVNRALLQWPQDRRRKILTTSGPEFTWLVTGLKDRMLAQREKARENVKAAEPVTLYVQSDPREVLEKMDTSALGVEFISRLFGQFDQMTKDQKHIEELLQRILARLPAAASTVNGIHEHAKRVKRILIVGLLPIQQGEVVKKFLGKPLEFRFIDTDTNNSRLPDADLYCLMVRFIRHKWQYQVDDKDKLLLIQGSTSDLIRHLERFIS